GARPVRRARGAGPPRPVIQGPDPGLVRPSPGPAALPAAPAEARDGAPAAGGAHRERQAGAGPPRGTARRRGVPRPEAQEEGVPAPPHGSREEDAGGEGRGVRGRGALPGVRHALRR
ncbi:hypothetical protein THAOC_11804, partial [Thalassiosira oceanica]